ncbi:mutS protein homolog 5 [Ixodes scapularis]
MSSLVDFTAVLMVRAAGGLLNFLDQNKRNCLDGSQDRHVIRGLVLSDLKDRVRMTRTAFGGLHIFKEEWHPSVFKCGISKKEGLSLFGLFNQCKSKVGEKELRKLLCRPTKDVDKLRSRQDSIAYFLTPQNQLVMGSLRQCLSHVRDLTNILMRMSVAAITVTQWKTFYKVSGTSSSTSCPLTSTEVFHRCVPIYRRKTNQACESMIAIRGICQSSLTPSDGIDVLKKMASLSVVDLLRVASLVEKIHDFEGSQAAGRFVVNRGIDSVLDERKRIYNGLPDLLTRIAYQELDRLDDRIPECQVVYLPQIGYLLTLSQQDVVSVDLPALQFLFACDDKNYYKSGTTKSDRNHFPHLSLHLRVSTRKLYIAALDGILGDTMYEIIDRETEIMFKVQKIILEVAGTLIDSVAVCGELDALLSLALVAHERGYVRPSLSADPVIQINGGRHPLLEVTTSSCVPNSYSSGGSHAKIKVLTGPNNCGKSVYLKTVALIVYMAHIGSYVPAEAALIGPVDSIRTCMSVDESLLHGLSSFALDLQQMSQIYQGRGERSLVVLDEFGKGTRRANGIGLLVATIESFLEDSDQCPHVILATHFHLLHDILPSSPLLSHQTFASLHHQGEMVYLYQLIEGHARGSCAGLVALSANVARDVVQRQQQIVKSRSANSNIGVLRLERKQHDWTEVQEAVDMLLSTRLSTPDAGDGLLQRLFICTTPTW